MPEDQIIDDQGEAVAIVDEIGAEEETDSDVVTANQEVSSTDESSNLGEALIDADVVALQNELDTNPDGDVAAYLTDEILSVGGFISNLSYGVPSEQKTRTEAWIVENLSQTTRNEYTDAKIDVARKLKDEGFEDGVDSALY